MDPRGEKKAPRSVKQVRDSNAKRLKTYESMAGAEKKELSLQRCLKYREATTTRLLANTYHINAVERVSQPQDDVNTRQSCYIPKTGTSMKGKNAVRPFCIFEKGSTSGTSNEPYTPGFAPVVTNGPANNRRTMTNNRKILTATNRLCSQYVPLKKVPNCKFCSAKKIEYEPLGFCCAGGTVKLSSHRMPPALKNLYMGNNEISDHIQTYIRTYSNLFAFTSLGVNYDRNLAKRNQGIYTFRVQGQMYHLIDDLYPGEKRPRNLQLYFYDNENEVEHRMNCSDKVNETIVKELMDILKENPYSMFLRSLTDAANLPNYHIALKCDAGLDQRVYSLPTTTEIAAVWIDENDCASFRAPHVQIYTHSNIIQRVNYYFRCYDPLQYPLLFPYGQGGWHCGIKKFRGAENISRSHALPESEQLPNVNKFCSVDGYLDMENQTLQKGKRKRDTVSVREYYCYKYQMRNDDEDEILDTGRLLQQYSVDEYIKMETQRLDFVNFNQDLFRMDVLQGLLDVLRLGERDASNIGKGSFLPNSFIGGPRDMLQRYMDATALVQSFGKPDLFITMTCNPSWMKIEEHLLSSDEAQNRPDLISRVFRAKIEELKTDLLKRNILGKVLAFMYTVEFQKRDLPHAHFHIILANEDKLLTTEAYDDIIRAELPDLRTESDLHSLVVKHMMHGPCGNLNPTNTCMRKNGCCKFKYPKAFADQTSKGTDSYPIYRRRNTGEVVKVRRQYLDNSWAVPYNPYLLAKYNCHINVEVCSDIKVVKYLYKYICKGHDKIAFSVQNNDEKSRYMR